MNIDFAEKRLVLTGAAGIFGRRIARYFAQRGARLCLSDRRADALHSMVADLELDPSRILVHETKLTRQASMDELVAMVAREWGAPDILVSNAGIYTRFDLMQMDLSDWDLVMDVNVRAPFYLGREMAKLMIAEGVKGSIIDISSGAARQMNTTGAPYCISKTAVDRLSKGLALACAQHGIRVNVVEPGFAQGSEVSHLDRDYVARMLERIPLGRESGPEDAPAAIAFLCSEAAGFITGATLSVDGGNSIGTYQRPRAPE